MNSSKDKFSMTFKTAFLIGLAAISAFAESDSLVQRQASLLEKLDSLNASVLGFRIGGTVKAGALTSKATSDQMDANSPSRENEAYTEANLVLTARPSSETEARVEIRLHKDWQDGYEEGVNPVIGHWFSYDGLIFNRHLAFNLGYMRVGYTPLTVFVPQDEVLQEPEIFYSRRAEALAQRNLDTSSNRLLQGLNVEYHSGQVGVLSDIYAHATGARMRNITKKIDQVFFDFDWSDRYMFAAAAGVSAYGFTVGGNYVTTFDRRLSSHSRKAVRDGVYYYEDNYVGSGVLGFDSKGVVDSPVHFGFDGEFAASKWRYSRDSSVVTDSTITYSLVKGSYVTVSDGLNADTLSTYYVNRKATANHDWEETLMDRLSGTAFHVQPYAETRVGDFDLHLDALYMQNSDKFWSEQASSRNYSGNTSILNSASLFSGQDSTLLSYFRSGSLENMYFSVYNTNVLQQQNLMSKNESGDILVKGSESNYTYARLYNNYRLAHFYRNGYTATTYKLTEIAAASEFMDAASDIALPYGLATPGAKGFAANGNFSWNAAVDLNLRVGSFSWEGTDNKFLKLGGGIGVDVSRIFGWDRVLKLQGSYMSIKEDKELERETSRIIAGLSATIWGPFSLLGGVQVLTKDYGNGLDLYGDASITVDKIEESLVLAGPQVKLAPGAYLDVECGYLTNKVSYTSSTVGSQELSIDKMIVMANVSVLF